MEHTDKAPGVGSYWNRFYASKLVYELAFENDGSPLLIERVAIGDWDFPLCRFACDFSQTITPKPLLVYLVPTTQALNQAITVCPAVIVLLPNDACRKVSAWMQSLFAFDWKAYIHAPNETKITIKRKGKAMEQITPEKGKKLVIFTCGNKGGTGKTLVMSAIVDYFKSKGISVAVFDADEGNKTVGSLWGYHPNDVKKVKLSQSGIDEAVNEAWYGEASVTCIDFPVGSEYEVFKWFDDVCHGEVAAWIEFCAVSAINASMATANTLYHWADYLGSRCRHLVFKNHAYGNDFSTIESSEDWMQFIDDFEPKVIDFEKRAETLQVEMENRGMTPYTFFSAKSEKKGAILRQENVDAVMRGYLDRANAAFLQVEDVILPSSYRKEVLN